MATRAEMEYRSAEVQKRLDASVRDLATLADVELPEPFPYARDPQFRAIDEREWLAITLERILDKIKGG